MEDEFRSTFGLPAGDNSLVETIGFPSGESLRLTRDELRPHGEIRLRQQDRVFVFSVGAHGERARTLATRPAGVNHREKLKFPKLLLKGSRE